MNWITALFTDRYQEGYADGWQAAAKAAYEREQRRRAHDPKTCKLCQQPCTCGRHINNP